MEIEKLKNDLSLCSENCYCDFHKKKKDNISMKIDDSIYSDNKFLVVPSEKITSALKTLNSNRQVAGSWYLISEERKWLIKNLNYLMKTDNLRNIYILGIAGTTHFFDTLSLISSIPTNVINLTVIEKCIKPLIDIKRTLLSLGYSIHIESEHMLLSREKITIRLVNDDICSLSSWSHSKPEIILSHYLLRFMTSDESNLMWENIGKMSVENCAILMAQDSTEYVLDDNFPTYFEGKGFSIKGIEPSWGIFKISENDTNTLLSDNSITINSDEKLIFLRKI